MSSRHLSSEFRPRTFNDVLGHTRYVNAFKKMIRQGTAPNCLLLAGPAGTGKTSLSRVLAAALMCKNINLDTSQPCGECGDCKAAQGINDGANFMHMDGAGSQLKDQVEGDLKAFLYSTPFGGSRAKVCLADEAQALSAGAKNALLTLTENLPASAFFIMTTTDPEAIDFAVRSRSFKIYLQGIPANQMIEGVLRHKPELNEHIEELKLLAAAAKGCMREMWQLVQQLESFDEPITPELAAFMTGGAKDADRKRLWQAIQTKNFKQIVTIWDHLLASGANHDRLGEQLLEDLIDQSAANPYARDWVNPIRRLSQAQVLGTPHAWRSALCAIAPESEPVKAQSLNLADAYQVLYEREPR